jgi:hypothetical protein
VPGGSRFYGTFDRAEAVRREELDFFASGHPLVEGLLAELADGPRGRAACLELPSRRHQGEGLLVLRRAGEGVVPEVVDLEGRARPEWRAAVLDALPRARDADPASFGLGGEAGRARLRAAARAAGGDGAGLEAVALFRFG